MNKIIFVCSAVAILAGCATIQYHKGEVDTGRDTVKRVTEYGASNQVVKTTETRTPVLRTQVDVFDHTCGMDLSGAKVAAKVTSGGTASFGADQVSAVVSTNTSAIVAAAGTSLATGLDAFANAYSTVMSGGTLNADTISKLSAAYNSLVSTSASNAAAAATTTVNQ